MGLADEIDALRPARLNNCGIHRVRELLNDKDREALDVALADRSIPHMVLFRALVKYLPDMKPKAVDRHRRKECRCEPR